MLACLVQVSYFNLLQMHQAFSTCTLKELCPEDKQKVAKLVKQVRFGISAKASQGTCTCSMGY